MAKFKPYKILESQLDSLPIREGQFILTTDTKKLYSDTAANTRILISPDAITDLSVNGTTITYTRLDGTTGTITTKDTTYSVASETKNGLMSSDDKAKLNAIESGAQKNTVTGIKGDSETLYRTGNVNITKSNIGLSNVENKSSATIRGELTSSNVTTALGYTPLNSNLKGANNGLAELDASGKVPTSQLPSYVDDVLEYGAKANFPTTGEAGKIYVDTATNKTYRWGGSAYVEISPSLALGTTSSTAFRGDYGNTAYSHATNKGAAFGSGLYKITTNAEGHVTAATAAVKSDITALGIPAQDTTYGLATSSVDGLMSSDDKNKLLNIEAGAQKNKVHGVKGSAETEYRTGNINITKANIGLGNVENKSSQTIRSEITKADVTAALGYTPPTQDTNTTYENATTNVSGLMSGSDKYKLDNIEDGAQKNTILGVKGSAETDYRTGYVNIYKDDIGLAYVDNTADVNKSVKSAGQLTTARNINGVAFDGTKNITITANPTTTTLTNEDLNSIKTPGLYNAGGGNTTANKPSGIDAYGLFVYKTASGYVTQEMSCGNNNAMMRYIRQFTSSSWSAWTQMKYTDTTYTGENGVTVSGTKISNSGVRSVATGDNNGTIKVNTNGTEANVSVKGLANAAYKGVDTSIAAASTSTNLPTSAAVASFVEGKGYKTTDNNTTYTFATGDANGQIKVTPSGGSAQNVSVKGLGSLAYKSSLAASDVGAIASTAKGAANGVAELDANGKVPTAQLPSYVDDVLEYSAKSSFPTTGETGKIYIDQATNKTYRWSGSAYAEISASLALGTTSSTAYRGDYGNTAYTHATDSSRLTTAKTSGLYKVASTAQGHIASLTAVTKEDITGLGIPGSNTDTTYTFATGDSNGQIKVTPKGGSAQNVSVKGLAAAAYKGVDTSMSKTSTSTNVPTTKAVADLITAEMANVSVDGVITSSNETVENIVSLTKAEYEALTEKEPNTLYHITDDINDVDLTAVDVVPTGARIGYNGTSSDIPEGYEQISISKNVSDNLPVGSGMDYYGTTAPYGYLFADGSAISRTEYPELFKVIGTTYGAGDGSRTFNLPDKRSRVSVMKDSGTFATLGGKGGAETHTLTTNELASHSHRGSAYFTGYSGWSGNVPAGYYAFNLTGTVIKNTDTSAITGQSSAGNLPQGEATGKGQAHNNLQPYLVCNYIIKVKNTSTYDTFMFDLGGAY